MVYVHDAVANTDFESSNPYTLVSHHGSFFLSASNQSTSAWDGLYFFNSQNTTAHKVLHAITTDQTPTHLHVGKNTSQKESELLIETNSFVDECFVYQAQGQARIALLFDIREANNYDTSHRFHTIEQLTENTYKIIGNDQSYILMCSQKPRMVDEWVEIQTSYDQRRQANSEWWVHQRMIFDCSQEIKISIARTQEQAQKGFAHTPKLITQPKEHPVYERAKHALEQLVVSTSSGAGILAGYPWFTQVWTRDEAISLAGLFIEQQYSVIKDILLRQVSRIDSSGRISNRTPGSDLGSADGVGWVFTRLHELYVQAPQTLSDDEWLYCYEQLCLSLDRLFTTHSTDGLIINAAKETWMDTEGSTEDLRAGACIEIQALTARSLVLAVDLAKKFHANPSYWQEKLEVFSSRIKQAFFVDGCLADQASDTTIRPNLFIAAYVYPQLLSDDEWKEVYRNALDALWLDWGALSTIDTSHELFQPVHTGMHDDSYHRGDSWYWVNALSACVLSRHEEFVGVAQQLVAACSKDLCELGVIGHPSEISSASQQEAFGCWSQAWSASLLMQAIVCLDQK